MAKPERGFTLIELLIVVAIISIIAAVAVPGLLRAKIQANEASAVVGLRAVAAAQTSYSTGCGGGSYAASFPVLGTASPGSQDSYLSADLAGSVTPQKAGYTYALSAGLGSAAGDADCNGTATITSYYATTTPLTFGQSGGRAFAVNGANTIWQMYAATPPTEPFGAPATPVK